MKKFKDFNSYQKQADKTQVYRKTKVNPFLYLSLGLTGEAGELAEKVKKLYRDRGGKLDEEYKNLIIKELGDVLWYLSQLGTELHVSLDEIASFNLEKLSVRAREGKIHGDGDLR